MASLSFAILFICIVMPSAGFPVEGIIHMWAEHLSAPLLIAVEGK